jgi:hypothetical protein
VDSRLGDSEGRAGVERVAPRASTARAHCSGLRGLPAAQKAKFHGVFLHQQALCFYPIRQDGDMGLSHEFLWRVVPGSMHLIPGSAHLIPVSTGPNSRLASLREFARKYLICLGDFVTETCLQRENRKISR